MKKKKQVPEWLNSSMWFDNRRLEPPEPPFPPPIPAAVAVAPSSPPPGPVSVREDPPNNHDASSSCSDFSLDDAQPQLLAELSRKVIDMRELRRVASHGAPAPALRPTLWKLLLGYLPPDRALWSSELANKRTQYKHFKDDLLINPSVRNY